MSFLTRSLPRAARTQFSYAPRAFSTSFVVRKSAVETVKDAAKTVDRAVSEKLADGIEASQNAAQKVKETAGMSTSEMQAKASEVSGEASGKASELTGKAKGAAADLSSMSAEDVKGRATELTGEAKGKANELSGEAKGKAAEVKGKM